MLTVPTAAGGAGFGARWDPAFLGVVRTALTGTEDPANGTSPRSLAPCSAEAIARSAEWSTPESHDDVANGQGSTG